MAFAIIFAFLLSGCAGKKGPQFSWPVEQQLQYNVSVDRTGMPRQTGSIDFNHRLILDFDVSCNAAVATGKKQKMNCRITSPIRSWEDVTKTNLLSQETAKGEIKTTWKERELKAVTYEEVGPFFEDVIGNVMGGLSLHGIPDECQPDYSWKNKGSKKLMETVGLSGPGSYRVNHTIQSCGEQMVIVSAGQSTASAQALDNAQAAWFGFESIRTTAIDEKSGVIVFSTFAQKLVSSSTRADAGAIVQTITITQK